MSVFEKGLDICPYLILIEYPKWNTNSPNTHNSIIKKQTAVDNKSRHVNEYFDHTTNNWQTTASCRGYIKLASAADCAPLYLVIRGRVCIRSAPCFPPSLPLRAVHTHMCVRTCQKPCEYFSSLTGLALLDLYFLACAFEERVFIAKALVMLECLFFC